MIFLGCTTRSNLKPKLNEVNFFILKNITNKCIGGKKESFVKSTDLINEIKNNFNQLNTPLRIRSTKPDYGFIEVFDENRYSLFILIITRNHGELIYFGNHFYYINDRVSNILKSSLEIDMSSLNFDECLVLKK